MGAAQALLSELLPEPGVELQEDEGVRVLTCKSAVPQWSLVNSAMATAQTVWFTLVASFCKRSEEMLERHYSFCVEKGLLDMGYRVGR